MKNPEETFKNEKKTSSKFLFLKVFLLILALASVIYSMKLLESGRLDHVFQLKETEIAQKETEASQKKEVMQIDRKAKIIKFVPKEP